MKYLALTALFLLACVDGLDLTGLNQELQLAVDDGRIGSGECDALDFVGDKADCRAFNLNGTLISFARQVRWNSTADSVVVIDQDGHMEAVGSGTTRIIMAGARGTSVSVDVTVP